MVDPTHTAAWKALVAHRDEVNDLQMRDLFLDDPDRADAILTRRWATFSSISRRTASPIKPSRS